MKKLFLSLLVIIAIASLAVAGCRGQEAAPATPQQPAAPQAPQPAAPVATTAPQAPQQPATPLPAAPAPTAVPATVAPVATPTVAAPVVRPAPTAVTGPIKGGNLRVVSQASIKSLDSIFTAAYVTNAVNKHVFEMLFGWDINKIPRPQAAGKWSISNDQLTWEITLRDGLTFHDGDTVTTDDVIASLNRWRNRTAGGQFLYQFLDGGAPNKVDDKTFTMKFTRPVGVVPEVLSHISQSAAIYKAEAAANPHTTDIGEKNIIGSGPYKLAKWEVGNRVIVERHAAYVPRSEPGSYMAGGSVPHLDRIEWLEIPTEETKIAGLKTAQYELVDGAGLDFFESLSKDPNLSVAKYFGHQSTLDFNWEAAPSSNQKLRQAVLAAVDAEAFMSSLGPKETWRLCPARYFCDTPLESRAGQEFYNQKNMAKAKQLLAESGYNNEPFVVMNPTDYATITPLGQVLKPMLEEMGINVQMPAMDWATLISRLTTDPKGWNMITDWGTHGGAPNPLLDTTISGTLYFGGYKSPRLQDLRLKFAFATTDVEKKKIVDEINLAWYDEVLRINLGEFALLVPHSKKVKNLVLPSTPPVYYNVWLER
jgi:peptide/nickel transport system substrate-binding protein